MKFLARHFFHMVDETRHLLSGGSGMLESIGEDQRLLLPGLMRYEFGNWSRCTPPIPSAMALSTCQRSGPLTDATKCSELWLSDFTLCHGPAGEAFNSVRPQLCRICCASEALGRSVGRPRSWVRSLFVGENTSHLQRRSPPHGSSHERSSRRSSRSYWRYVRPPVFPHSNAESACGTVKIPGCAAGVSSLRLTRVLRWDERAFSAELTLLHLVPSSSLRLLWSPYALHVVLRSSQPTR